MRERQIERDIEIMVGIKRRQIFGDKIEKFDKNSAVL